ncbi:hypothetical protein MK489_09145 [Myxococcota bacterium]|nr:hypothetical protein [Myxococcota bacterium]
MNSPQQNGTRPWRALWPWPLVAALLALHFSSFAPSTRPIVTDVRYSLYYAWRVLEGDAPHRDLYAIKTQLAVFLGAGLQALGEFLEIDGLLAIRVGYLALAALGGLLLFAIHRRLGHGSQAAGFLGLAAYLSFGLLGELPSVGNVSKLVMAVSASAAALLVHKKRWFGAGMASGLAFLDWQVGGLVGLAALVALLVQERPRMPAILRLGFGAALAGMPMLGFFAFQGALGDFLEQVGPGALARGVAAASVGGPSALARIWNSVPRVCPEQEWLFAAALMGLPLLWGRLLWPRDRDLQGLLLPLAIYHTGILLFFAVDNQGYGDFFLLLHSIAFFLGVTWNALAETTIDLAGRRFSEPRGGDPRRLRRGLQTVWIAAALLAARPGPMRPDIPLRAPQLRPGATLEDQRHVAGAMERVLGDGRLVALENIELLYLLKRENLVPTAYFNDVIWRKFRLAEESRGATAARMIEVARADAFLLPARMRRPAEARESGYRPVVIRAPSGHYAITLHLGRRPAP